MHFTILRPASEALPPKPKHNPERTPQRNQRHVRHDRRNIPRARAPRRDELAEAVAPEVFVDGDGHEYGAADGLV
jgi:hypothetical protein